MIDEIFLELSLNNINIDWQQSERQARRELAGEALLGERESNLMKVEI